MIVSKNIDLEKSLYRWNVVCGSLHLIQAIICVILSQTNDRIKNFKLPLTTSFLQWDPIKDKPIYGIVITQGYLPFAVVTSLFSFLSAAAHFTVILFFNKYINDINKGINRFRWWEYALSSSLMIALIAMLYGMYDIISLILLMSVNAAMITYGDIMELQNQNNDKKNVHWIGFIYGSIYGVVPWAVIFAYLGGSPSVDLVPGFVWAILFCYLVLFCIFPINMYLQYAQIGRWNDSNYPTLNRGGYFFGEKVYQILSLTAKSLLLWLVVGGTNQPN